MTAYRAEIFITLKPSVLDPAGTAITKGLQQQQYPGVQEVRIGKYIELTLTAADASTAHAQVEQMCQEVLTNPVIETYRFTLEAGR
ncbi:phosphoribosylformylglycinamidine synthase subunit PurS [Gloeomargarita lithophora Alchichica-D10]|uniref:Phosphoribosylformylglycinamidine synthase subunit PurS n=1 Tax=Gloeomargarita lithophora Alchichica-D10 TaxID=1188229 RepID=A0A1J0AAU8_9CYAN|nr:phosphoribosylformylglycinamidine synthase subunit PurS [Gloeomargarita lithophora]APB33054.1 phosphoribosylformylglycinamidine synthase subunit PurS [Gloeomargarita lithophora Alchichica-D10]